MALKSINFSEKLNKIAELWTPKVIAEMNDYQFKLAKVGGEFVWHSHPQTDEVFVVLSGSLVIRMPDGDVRLEEGEMYVVKKGVQHQPVAEQECHILLIEPKGVVNTGDVDSQLTAKNDVWV